MLLIHRNISPFSEATPFFTNDLPAPFGPGVGEDVLLQFTSKHFPVGSTIIERDSVGSALWILTAGHASVIHGGKSEWAVSRPARVGEVFGLTEVLAELPYAATVRAMSPCSCVMVEGVELRGLLAASAPFRRALMGRLSRGYIAAYKKIRGRSECGDTGH
jgi:CRP-like cAMP-binding protein